MCLFGVLCFTATCEMCGMVGVRDAFYSKTKRFCSVSCSRSYSSNSKKASILARLQVSALLSYYNTFLTLNLYYFINAHVCFDFSRANHQQKRRRSYRNSLLWQSWLLTPSTKQVNRTRPNQKLVCYHNTVMIVNRVTVLLCFDVHQLYTVSCVCQWSLQRALTGVGTSVAITRLELQSAVSSTWVKTVVE